MSEESFIVQVLETIAKHEAHNDIWWRCDGACSRVTFFVICNDLFSDAADAERITTENLPLLRQTYEECEKLDCISFASHLFCCRVRRMCPQTAWWGSGIPKPSDEVRALFEACGEVDHDDRR